MVVVSGRTPPPDFYHFRPAAMRNDIFTSTYSQVPDPLATRGAAGNGGPCQRLILMDVPSVSLNPVPGDCGVCIGLRVRDASGNPEGGLQQASDATSSTQNADRNMVRKATAG